jgi:hypothetical protein
MLRMDIHLLSLTTLNIRFIAQIISKVLVSATQLSWEDHFSNALVVSLVHGNGSDLVWSNGGDYAVKDGFIVRAFEGSSNTQLFEFSTDYLIEGLFGGPLL